MRDDRYVIAVDTYMRRGRENRFHAGIAASATMESIGIDKWVHRHPYVIVRQDAAPGPVEARRQRQRRKGWSMRSKDQIDLRFAESAKEPPPLPTLSELLDELAEENREYFARTRGG